MVDGPVPIDFPKIITFCSEKPRPPSA